MTSDEMRAAAADKAAVMTAFSQGKTIEERRLIATCPYWATCDNPEWDFSHYEYRVKRETIYKPFLAKDLPELVGRVVKHKNYPDRLRLITECDVFGVFIGSAGKVDLTHLFTYYTFLDGTPCGVATPSGVEEQT